MDPAFLITAFATLFVVIDPVGLTPMFIALTQDTPAKFRRSVAVRACLIALGVLALFTFLGEAVLGVIGISMPAFKIAGGMLLFLTALEMLFERRSKRRQSQSEEEDFPDPSVFPMAIPLIAGPGAIASVILLAGQNDDWAGVLSVLGVTALVVGMALLLFLLADPIERALGRTGISVVTRLLGMLLAALSVQFVLDGLREVGFGAALG